MKQSRVFYVLGDFLFIVIIGYLMWFVSLGVET
jgi:hypothetical protein